MAKLCKAAAMQPRVTKVLTLLRYIIKSGQPHAGSEKVKEGLDGVDFDALEGPFQRWGCALSS